MATIARAVRFCGSKGPDQVSLLYISQRHKSTNVTTSNYKRGTGGRSSFNGKVVTVFGAKSALGLSLVNRLGKTGSQVICAYRGDPYFMRDFRLMGDLGQILFSDIDLRDEDSLRRAMQYSNMVINLIGKEYETRNFSFNDIHVEGPRKIARIAKELDVDKLVHVSTMNAGVESNFFQPGGSKFLKSKYEGELAVREEFPEAVIIRPARFLDLDDKMRAYYTKYPRKHKVFTFNQGFWNCIPFHKECSGVIRMPVRIKDVSEGISNALDDPEADGKIFQFVGPYAYRQLDLVDYIYSCKNKKAYFSKGVQRVKFRAWLGEKLYKTIGFPLPELTMDMLEKECVSEELDPYLPTLLDLGVTPEDATAIIEFIYRPGLSGGVFIDRSIIPPKVPTPPELYVTY